MELMLAGDHMMQGDNYLYMASPCSGKIRVRRSRS